MRVGLGLCRISWDLLLLLLPNGLGPFQHEYIVTKSSRGGPVAWLGLAWVLAWVGLVLVLAWVGMTLGLALGLALDLALGLAWLLARLGLAWLGLGKTNQPLRRHMCNFFFGAIGAKLGLAWLLAWLGLAW